MAREISILLFVADTELQVRLMNGLSNRYQFECVPDTKESLKMAFLSVPDFVIIQGNLVPDNAIEISKSLKSNQLTSHIPLILILNAVPFPIDASLSFVDIILPISFTKRELVLSLQQVISLKIRLMKRYPIFYKSDNAFAREHDFLNNYIKGLQQE